MIVSQEDRRHARARRPALEPLEDRKLLATIHVNTFQDLLHPPPGMISLRSAIARADTDHQADTILVPAGTYPTSGGYQLLADRGLKIEAVGGGVANIVAEASSDSVFVVHQRAQVTLVGLRISGGSGHPTNHGTAGGGLFNSGETVLINCIVSDNTAFDGGGIYNESELTIEGGSIQRNRATSDGGGVINSRAASGGGRPDELSIRRVVIRGNTARRGGGLANSSGPAEIRGSSIFDNSGGDLFASSPSKVTVSDSTIG
jgi:hypothetical protein